jgi:hypothetical protein
VGEHRPIIGFGGSRALVSFTSIAGINGTKASPIDYQTATVWFDPVIFQHGKESCTLKSSSAISFLLGLIRQRMTLLSLDIKIMESDLYDWNPLKRFLLCIIARGQRKNKKAYIPPDMPPELQDDIIGWCDQAQWRLAQRLGKDTDYTNEVLRDLENDETINVRTWRDKYGVLHNQYRVKDAVVEARQRPEHKEFAERPPRYKVPRTGNKGSFSSSNQPRRVKKESKAQKRLREAEMYEAPAMAASAAVPGSACRDPRNGRGITMKNDLTGTQPWTMVYLKSLTGTQPYTLRELNR